MRKKGHEVKLSLGLEGYEVKSSLRLEGYEVNGYQCDEILSPKGIIQI